MSFSKNPDGSESKNEAFRSSDGSGSESEVTFTQRNELDSAPRTPLSPDETVSSTGVSKTQRSNSIVRFQGLKLTLEDEDRSIYRRSQRSPAVPPANIDEDDPVRILAERIDHLQSQFQNLELSRHLSSSEKGDESSERTGLSTEIQWLSWQEYLEDASKATNVLEVLAEKPHTNSRRKSFIAQPTTEISQRQSVKSSSTPDPCKNIERIRIRSPHIINALQAITEQTFSSSSRLIIHRPFKVLLFYNEQILDYLMELEQDFAKNTECVLGEKYKGFVELDENNLFPQTSRRTRSSKVRRTSFSEPLHASLDVLPSGRSNCDECKHEISEELLAQVEAIIHLRVLTKFMKEDMEEIFAKHDLLRSSEAKQIAFQDMWHLFQAGDLVVTESESQEKGFELYQVSILPAADIFSSRRPVKQIQTKTEGSHQFVESVYQQGTDSAMSVFNVDVFYFDFDGQNFGPVERRLSLVSYEGEKSILDLPLYPLRFCQDAVHIKDIMLKRGKKFRELSIPNQFPHREYNGLSVGEPQEQVSQFSDCEGTSMTNC